MPNPARRDTRSVRTPTDLAEAASMLRSVIEAIESGQLDAISPKARVFLRHLEGAVAMLDALIENARGGRVEAIRVGTLRALIAIACIGPVLPRESTDSARCCAYSPCRNASYAAVVRPT
jgi:hypothetical protein